MTNDTAAVAVLLWKSIYQMVKPSSVRVPTLKSYTVKRKELGILQVESASIGKMYLECTFWRTLEPHVRHSRERGLQNLFLEREFFGEGRLSKGRLGGGESKSKKQWGRGGRADVRMDKSLIAIIKSTLNTITYSAADSDRRHSRRIYISDNRVLSDSSCYSPFYYNQTQQTSGLQWTKITKYVFSRNEHTLVSFSSYCC